MDHQSTLEYMHTQLLCLLFDKQHLHHMVMGYRGPFLLGLVQELKVEK